MDKSRNHVCLVGICVMLTLTWLLYVFAQVHFPVDAVKGFDFQLRYNETRCVLAGIDPFLVWNGTESLAPYVPWSWDCPDIFSWHDYVAGYPPWTYAYMLPIAVLPKSVAAHLWLAFEYACACALVGFVFFFVRRRTGSLFWGLSSLTLAGCLLLPLMACVSCLNFGLPITVFAILFCHCLNRNRDWGAGVCWAIMMVKPQIGLLFAVPVLLCRRYKVAITACLVCIVATLITAGLCARSPVALLAEMTKMEQAYPSSGGHLLTLLIPGDWLRGLGLSPRLASIMNASVGLGACSVLTRICIRRTHDWFVITLPSYLLCCWWTVSRLHDACVDVVTVSVLIVVFWYVTRSQAHLAKIVIGVIIASSVVQTFLAMDFVQYCVYLLLVLITPSLVLCFWRKQWSLAFIFLVFFSCALTISLSPFRYSALIFSVLQIPLACVMLESRREGAKSIAALLLLATPFLFFFAPRLGFWVISCAILASLYLALGTMGDDIQSRGSFIAGKGIG